MPKIADQVAALEHDLNAALATIDQLTAANSALVSANASLQRDNVGLQLEINDMKHYVDDTRELADRLAASALDMLRTSRRHVGPAPLADEPKERPITKRAELAMPYGLDAKIAALPEKWPEQKAVAEIVAGDSDGEQPEDCPCGASHPGGKPCPGPDGRPLCADDKIHVTVAPPTNKFEPMPIFLQRDTAFETPNVRPIFG